LKFQIRKKELSLFAVLQAVESHLSFLWSKDFTIQSQEKFFLTEET